MTIYKSIDMLSEPPFEDKFNKENICQQNEITLKQNLETCLNEQEKKIETQLENITNEIEKKNKKESLNNITKIKSGIYKIVNKVNGKYYIGSAVNLNKRKWNHFSELKKQTHHNNKLQNAWNKYNSDAFEFIIVEYIENLDNLLSTEQKYLDIIKNDNDKDIDSHYNLAYNATAPMLGKTLTFEQKQYLRKINNGRKFSEKTIQKMKKSALGKIVSSKTREKLSILAKGRKISTEHIQKLSNKNKRNKYCKNRMLNQSSYDKRSNSLKKYYKSNPEFYEKNKSRCIEFNRLKMDWTIYNFINIKTKKLFTGNRYDFQSKFNLKRHFITNLIQKKHIHRNGWTIR